MENRRMNTIDGLPIVDAKKSVKIIITTHDIKHGKNKNPGACAAALACLRNLHCKQARVHMGRTYIRKGRKWVRYLTPESLRAEIVSFDRGGGFDSGVYNLGRITPTKTGYGMKGSATNQSGRSKRKKRPYHITTGVRQFGANR